MIITCPECNQCLRVPLSSNKSFRIFCSACNQSFNNPLRRKRASSEEKNIKKSAIKSNDSNIRVFLAAMVVVAIVLSLASLFIYSPGYAKKPLDDRMQNNWEPIQYGEEVNDVIITHSGETIGEILQGFQPDNPRHKGLLQPYLEPFSLICNDYLIASGNEKKDRFTNILSHYPVGSEQPAWAALFHEGHFQLYYDSSLVRVFIKGNDTETSFERHLSVIRHPLRDLFNSDGIAINKLEVYVFNNDYKNTQIWLNTIPQVYRADEIDLSVKREPLCLESIETFFDQGALLKAAEIDEENKFYLYGKGFTNSTIANDPVSLADIAVAYRAVFHYGYNAPYISLDQHEDNRYAKVNFGGNLQNTHIGHVILEADKLFKTLSTGLDPNTRNNVKNKFAHAVPGFLTEDERNLLIGKSHQEPQQLRYWFYPEKIMTVTNGSIGVVSQDQFYADTERINSGNSMDWASRETIDHLNKYFSYYQKAENTFKELSNVGRLMALMNWLKQLEIEDRVELDDLLSVKLPAFSTPDKTKKMLVVTAAAYPGADLTPSYVREHAMIADFSPTLKEFPPTTSDEQFLKAAMDYFSEMEKSEMYPSGYKHLEEQIDRYNDMLQSTAEKLELKSHKIEIAERNMNRQNSREIDNYNILVDEYNKLLDDYEYHINYYNYLVDELNSMDVKVNSVVSILGGISLRSEEFGKVIRDINSPLIQGIMGAKNNFMRHNNLYYAGEWVRSGNHSSGARINELIIGVSNN